MDELGIRFDLRLSPAVLRWTAAGILLSTLAPELATESVSLTTYYPAPSGIYAEMTTTGDTYLARNPGSTVFIGTKGPAPADTKVYVVGVPLMQNDTILEGKDLTPSPGKTRFIVRSVSPNLNFYGFDSAEFPFMSVNDSGSVNFRTEVGINNPSPSGGLDVRGEGVIALRQPSGDCNLDNNGPIYFFKGTQEGEPNSECPGGTYATMVQGLIARYSVPWGTTYGIPDPVNPAVGTLPGSGFMMCCKCPASGCNIFP